jgi:hypothetical protein
MNQILTTTNPTPNHKRIGEWFKKDGPRKHEAARNEGLEKAKRELGWYEPVEQ